MGILVTDNGVTLYRVLVMGCVLAALLKHYFYAAVLKERSSKNNETNRYAID